MGDLLLSTLHPNIIENKTTQTFLTMGLLALLASKLYAALKQSLGAKATLSLSVMKESFSPLIIAVGIFFMYRGRRYEIASVPAVAADVASTVEEDISASLQTEIKYQEWSYTFLFGESLVMTSFLANSFDNQLLSRTLVLALSAFCFLLSLWLRGRFWRYMTLLGFEGMIGTLVVLAFPIMEMILESLVEEKMRKVGEKIRAHDLRMKEMLSRKKGQPSGSL